MMKLIPTVAEQRLLRALLNSPTPIAIDDNQYFAHSSKSIYTARNKLLRQQGFQSYRQYLSSETWANNSAPVRDLPCYVCDGPSTHAHHCTYARIGNEDRTDLIPLCAEHHRELHVLLADPRHRVRLKTAHQLLRMLYRDEPLPKRFTRRMNIAA